MLRMKYFFLPIYPNSSASEKKESEESRKTIEDFLNKVGEEKIVQMYMTQVDTASILYTVIYRD